MLSTKEIMSLLDQYHPSVAVRGGFDEQTSFVAMLDEIERCPDRSHGVFVGYASTFLGLATSLRVGTFVLAHDVDIPESRIDSSTATIVVIENTSNLLPVHELLGQALQPPCPPMSPVEQLLPLFLHANDLAALTQTASKVLGNPILVTDSSYNILAHSFHEKLDDDIWLTGWQRGYLTFEFISQLKGDGSEGFETDPTRSSIIVSDISAHRRFVHKLTMQSQFLGYLIALETNRPFEDVPLETYQVTRDFLAKQVSLEAPMGTSAHMEREIGLLSDLMKDRIVNASMLKELIQGTWLERVGSSTVLAIDMRAQRVTGHTVQDELRKQLNTSFPNSRSLFFDEMLLTLFKGNVEHADLEAFLMQHQLQGGISDSFRNLLDLKWHYMQAHAAIRFGRLHGNPGPLHLYQDYRLDHMCSCLPAEHVQDFIDPQIRVLSRATDDMGKTLFETLEMFVVSGGSISETAQRLYVHRNTINYRLERLSSLYKIDCSAASIARHALSLQLIRYQRLSQQ